MKTLKITVAVAAVSLSLSAMGWADNPTQTFNLYNNTGVTMTLDTSPALQCLQAAVSPSPIPSGSMAAITVGGGSTDDSNSCEMTFDIPLSSPKYTYQLNIVYGVKPYCNGSSADGCIAIYSPEMTSRVSGTVENTPAIPVPTPISIFYKAPFPPPFTYQYNPRPYFIQINAQP
jgi:hypothetical protein